MPAKKGPKRGKIDAVPCIHFVETGLSARHPAEACKGLRRGRTGAPAPAASTFVLLLEQWPAKLVQLRKVDIFQVPGFIEYIGGAITALM